MEQEFEWDETKRQSNIETHGVDFADILPLFIQPETVVFEDTRKDYGEERYILMGELHDLLFQVAFTRRGTTIRIISARRGNKRERRIYEQREDD
jgi:uncharacterized DUF497 family protein